MHERVLPNVGPIAQSLIDDLGSAADRLWPYDRWPPMRLVDGLVVGSSGGHGPIRYHVLEHRPGRLVRFGFTAPRGLIGEHSFELKTRGQTVLLRHSVIGHGHGRMRWQWPLVVGPLHDALIEDSFDRAVATVSATPCDPAPWPLRVRALRRLARRLL